MPWTPCYRGRHQSSKCYASCPRSDSYSGVERVPSAPPISRGACASLHGASVLRYHMDTFTSLLPRMACGLWAAPGAQHNQLSPSPFCISSLDLPLGKPLSFLWFPGRSRVRQRDSWEEAMRSPRSSVFGHNCKLQRLWLFSESPLRGTRDCPAHRSALGVGSPAV